MLCDNEGQLERLEELLGRGPGASPSGLILAVGALDGGFALPGLMVFTDHQIFRRARRIRRPRRYRQASPAGVVAALKPGDVVVHLEHGIGIYRGMQTIAVGEGTLDVAAVEYEGGDLLHVPLYRIDQLERYRGVEASGRDAPPPKLHHLGGKRWARQRDQAQAAIHRLAVELLDLYARRQIAPGFAFPPDTRWQRELESSFLYEDTPDQRKATDAGEAGHGGAAADGPPGGRRRRLRQDRDRGARGVQGGAGGQAGGGARAHDDPRGAARRAPSASGWPTTRCRLVVAVALPQPPRSSGRRWPTWPPARWTSSSARTGCSRPTSCSRTSA